MQGKKYIDELEKVPQPEDFPTADAAAIKETIRIKVHPDGRIDHYHYLLKRLLTMYDRDKNCDYSILFNQKHQDVEVLSAKAMMNDGKIVETPEYGINQITPPELSMAPYYSDFQYRIVSLVGLEKGGYAEVEYEIKDNKPWRKNFAGTIPIRTMFPVMEREIVFETPEHRKPAMAIDGLSSDQYDKKEETADGVTRTVFTFKNLPLWDMEEEHELVKHDMPRLIYSETPEWNDQVKALSGLSEETMGADDEMKKRVDELLKDIDCPILKCFRLHKHVCESIAGVTFDNLEAFRQARSAAEVYKSGYGTSIERALVLASLIRQIDQEAEAALACPAPVLPDKVYHPGCFPHPWVWVRSLNLYFNPDQDLAKARREHLEDHVLLAPDKAMNNQIKMDGCGYPVGNRFNGKVNLTIKKDASAEGNLDVALGGIYNPYYQLYGEEPEKFEEWIKSYTGKIVSGAEPDKSRFRHLAADHSALKAKFKQNRLTEDEDNRFCIKFPGAVSDIGGFSIPLEVTERNSTYSLPGTVIHNLKIEMEIPPEFKLTLIPQEININNEAGEFKQKFEIKKDEKETEKEDDKHKKQKSKPTKALFTQTLNFKNKFVTPDKYNKLREILVQDAREQNRMLFLAKK